VEPASLPFTKMHGCGNDYVVVDGFADEVDDPVALARVVCDRRFGVGADGLLLALPSTAADLRMRMFNVDGSEAEMCGNGLRCLVKLAVERGRVAPGPRLRVETGAGVLDVEVERDGPVVDEVTIDLGAPRLDRASIPMRGSGGRVVDEPLDVDGEGLRVTALSLGNPHVVAFVADVDAAPLERLGPRVEHHEAFPRRTNLELVEVLSRDEVRQRTWERGCGETLACGTGACAVAVAGALTGRTDRALLVHLRGGDLRVEWRDDDHVLLSGPAVEVFRGVWPLEA
jgi:diaminopimelate epimerase